MPQTIVGCDLSCAFIDVCQNAGRAISRIQNTKSGIMEWIETLDPTAVIVFEAASGCDSILMDALAAPHINYARVNPGQTREFVRAQGVLNKDNPHRRGSTTASNHQCHDPKSSANEAMSQDTVAPSW